MVEEAQRANRMSARDAILAVARATRRDAPGDTMPIRRVDGFDPAQRLTRFLDRLAAYNVTIVRLADDSGVAATVAARLAERGTTTLVVPEGLPASWLPPVTLLHEASLDRAMLDGAPAIITSAALAIAETGTIVLDAGTGQGRRELSLLPDHHICVVFADQIVGLVPEAIAALQPAIAQRRPITFISGPSATADIEFDRVVGVHGPRTLDVLVVERRATA